MRKTTIEKANEQLSQQDTVRANVIDAIAETMDLYGINYTFGQLYGVMFFENRPLTLEDMQQHMKMSKSNMSYGVRSLLNTKMITKLDEKQDRKELYQAETDFFKTFQAFFAHRLQREIDIMGQAIAENIPYLESLVQQSDHDKETADALQIDLQKLVRAASFYEWLQKFVDDLEQGTPFLETNKATEL